MKYVVYWRTTHGDDEFTGAACVDGKAGAEQLFTTVNAITNGNVGMEPHHELVSQTQDDDLGTIRVQAANILKLLEGK